MNRHRARPPWSWPGVVAVLLAGSLGLGWAGALIIAAIHPMPTSDAGLNLLGSLGQTLAGAVAAYLGYQIGAGTSSSHKTGDAHTDQDQPLVQPEPSSGHAEADL